MIFSVLQQIPMAFLFSLPWTIPAVLFLFIVDRRGYSVLIGQAILLVSSFLGLAGLGGLLALRGWMISKTLLGPIIACVIAMMVPKREVGPGGRQDSPILRALFLTIAWGCWLGWNASHFAEATGMRSTFEHADLG